MSDNDKFEYNYSVATEKERNQVLAIKRSFEETKNTDFEKLKKLSNRVRARAMTALVILLVLGSLIFGGGLSLVLEFSQLIWGTALGLIGVAILSLSYPVYKAVYSFNKSKYASEILELSNKILGKD